MPAEPPPPVDRPTPTPSAPTRPPGRGYWRGLLPVLAVLALLTRLPSLRHRFWSPDEAYLAVQARILADGGELYETVVDRKPPLLPWLYEVALALFGDASPLAVKVLAIGAQLLTAALLASTARRRWGDRAGRTAGVLYLLVSVGLNPEDTQAATFEVFMLPFTAAAIRCADRGRWTAAGAAVAGAFLTKQTGGAVLVPVLWLLWRTHRTHRTLRAQRGHPAHAVAVPITVAPDAAAPVLRTGLPCTAVGFTAPVLAAALLTDPAGFVFWTVTGSGTYATAFAGSELHVLSRGLANSGLLALGCAGLLPPILRSLRTNGRPVSGAAPPTADLWVWLGSSAGAVLLGLHFFGHYFLQLLPPLVLLATAALRPLPRARLAFPLLVSACTCVLFVTWGLLAPRPELDHAERLAAAVRERTEPSERVLVWGIHPETYWLADRAPACRFLTAGLLTNYSGGRAGPRVGEEYAVPGAWQVFAAETAANPPALIVDDSRGKPYAPEHVPTLRRLLERHYRALPERVGGAVIYVRSSGS